MIRRKKNDYHVTERHRERERDRQRHGQNDEKEI